MPDLPRPRPLDGIKVLDFTTVMAGPYATRLLADLGADVLKIETLEGDQVRARPPIREGLSSYFGHLNAGKRSIALNLKSAVAIDWVKALVRHYDIVVENFRPGVMARLGLDFGALSAINPRLIFCSISGYGQAGPKAGNPAYAPVVHAESGFDTVNMRYQDHADSPATGGIFIADVLAGTHAFGAIQAALLQRDKLGAGQHIDVAMLDAMIGMLVFETQEAQFPGTARRPLYRPLRTSDGFIMVAPTSPRNFEQLAAATGNPDWVGDPRFLTNADRNANWSILLDLVEQWCSELTSAAAEKALRDHGVPCARYRDLPEILADTHLDQRGTFSQIDDGAGPFRVTNPPFKMSKASTEARSFVARLGEHGEAVLINELGLSREEVVAHRASGAIG